MSENTEPQQLNPKNDPWLPGPAHGHTDVDVLRLGERISLHGTLAQRIAFFAALAKAQAAYEPIARTRNVEVKSDKGSYTFDYAPLEEVLSATMPALNANGIAWLCVPTEGELHTILTHAEGAMLHSVEPLPAFDSPQRYGSALTYRRRYGYQCLTGTAPEYDDDGNEASGNKVQAMTQRNRQPPAPSKAPPVNYREAAERAQAASAQRAATAPAPATRPASVPPPAQRPPKSVPPPASAEEPPTDATMAAMDRAYAAEERGEAPEADSRPASQDQADEVVRLAQGLKWDRKTLNSFIADRITPGRVYTELTYAEAAALIPMLAKQGRP